MKTFRDVMSFFQEESLKINSGFRMCLWCVKNEQKLAQECIRILRPAIHQPRNCSLFYLLLQFEAVLKMETMT